MFPELPVLTRLRINETFNHDLSNYYIISVQHLLESTGTLFEEFIRIGFKPNNIFLTGKIYSTHSRTQKKLGGLGINITESSIPIDLGNYAKYLQNDIKLMWKSLANSINPNSKIIILDEGGYTLKNIPSEYAGSKSIFGIEQTTSGIRMISANCKIPVIQLAASAAKVNIEPPIVSEAIRIHLGRRIKLLKPRRIGIIGLGHIGQALVKDLSLKYRINLYDLDKSKYYQTSSNLRFCNNAEELFYESDIIIGATGKDIANLKWLDDVNENKTLISVSSSDIEFNTILRKCKGYLISKLNNPLQDLVLKLSNGYEIKIIRGGFVANFTGSANSSPSRTIQITRGLLFGAMIQVIKSEMKLRKHSGPIMLDPKLQSDVVNFWFHDQPQRKRFYSEEILNGFQNIEWIRNNSKGEYVNFK